MKLFTICFGFTLAIAMVGASAQDDSSHLRAAPVSQSNMEVQKSSAPTPFDKTDVSQPKEPAPFPPALPKSGVADRSRVFHSVPRDRIYFALDSDGAIWARGQTYKASFGTDGTTYVPFLGSCAPRNYPVHLALDSITIGGAPIEFDRFAPALRSADRVSFDRGALVEIYDLGIDSLEQSFELTSVPTSGDLVLRLNVQSELSRSEAADGLEFMNERGGVRYGRATAIDAAGIRSTLQTTLTGPGIEIRMSAAEVARMSFPLTIDPVISTFSIDVAPADDYLPDVAYDATNNIYCVSEEEAFSATDHDVYALKLSAAGVLTGAATVDITTNNWQTPKVANNGLAHQFLVVATVGLPSSGTRVVRGCEVAASNFASGIQFLISPPDQGGDKLNPDVGGDPVGVYYYVVWTRVYNASDTDVHAQVVTTSSTLLHPATVLVDDSGGTIDTVPHISKSCGQGGVWVIVWNRNHTSTDRDVRGAAVAFDGTLNIASSSIDAGSFDDTNPRVSSLNDGAGPGGQFLIVYERNYGSEHDVVGTLVHSTGFAFTVLDSENLSFTFENAFSTENQLHPSVDTDGQHYTVVYSESYQSSLTDYDIYASEYAQSAGVLFAKEVHQNLAFSIDLESNPLIASKADAGVPDQRSMIVWDDLVTSTNRDIQGALYDSLEGGSVTGFCAGDGSGTPCPCGNTGGAGHGCANSGDPAGALLTSTGYASTTNDTLTLIGSGQPPTALGVFLQGTTNLGGGVVFGAGLRCVGGTLIRLGPKIALNGTTQYPVAGDPKISVQGMVPAIGATRYYQLWYRDTTGPCATTTYNVSDGLIVVWIP